MVLFNGMPFQIKSIFGLTNPDEIDDKGKVKDVQGTAASKEELTECSI